MYSKKIIERKKISALIVSLILLFIFSFNFNMVWIDDNNIEVDLETSASASPIYIDDLGGGDYTWEEAAGQVWCSGSGTEGDPYKIEDLIIDGGGVDDCILIFNSIANFTIRNCTLYDGINTGILLFNVTNGYIVENNCSNNDWGIYIFQSSHNKVVRNNVYGTAVASGIALVSSSNTTIEENTLENNWQGIYLDNSNNNNISGNNAFKNVKNGICLEFDSNFNTLSENTNYNNTLSGFYLVSSDFNNLIENNAYNNKWDGINCDDCDFNNLTGNTAYNNTYDGIYLYSGYFNNLTGNTVYNNSQNGIYLEDSDDNIIEQNNVNNNMHNGILLDGSEFNAMSDNLIFDNLLHGISLIGIYSDSNNITKNRIYHNNESGIYIGFDMYYNEIWDNEIYDNTMHGIYLYSVDYAEYYGNWIYDNKEFGIYCTSGSNDNLFYENVFVRNKKHAVDDGGNNDWNSTAIGNYWDNHTGPDANSDGIVDIQYNITGLATSIDYLPIAEDGAPIITIVSPNDGDVFNESAPDFTITVTDDFLKSMWYTIDGGPTTYPFTSLSGTIDQTAWDALSDGNVTLTFYANDLPLNTGTDEVVIEKDTQAPVITINSPADGDVFGKTPPSFNITVTDPNLDTIWYTVDSNFTIIDSTLIWTINQTIWSALPEGSVTITIYANDTLGHTSSKGITITKNIPSKVIGLDYFTTSVLIFLISGVAIIGIITIMYHKKRIIS